MSFCNCTDERWRAHVHTTVLNDARAHALLKRFAQRYLHVLYTVLLIHAHTHCIGWCEDDTRGTKRIESKHA
jgi:hypothetical protein